MGTMVRADPLGLEAREGLGVKLEWVEPPGERVGARWSRPRWFNSPGASGSIVPRSRERSTRPGLTRPRRLHRCHRNAAGRPTSRLGVTGPWEANRTIPCPASTGAMPMLTARVWASGCVGRSVEERQQSKTTTTRRRASGTTPARQVGCTSTPTETNTIRRRAT